MAVQAERDLAGGGRAAPLDAYVPTVVLRHLAEAPSDPVLAIEGTMLLADISGFTRMAERLARLGRQGAEDLVGTIDRYFEVLLGVVHAEGGSALKLAGDALLVFFDGEGHAAAAARSAVALRRALRETGPLATSAGTVRLRVSQGLHSGVFHHFLVGASHREHLIAGPAVTEVVRMEKAAGSGEILMSAATAARLPRRCAGAEKAPGRLVAAAPPGAVAPPRAPSRQADPARIAGCLSTAVRAHLRSGEQPPEHRIATVAFVNAIGTDALVERDGPHAAAEALGDLVADVQRAVDEQQVCFLESDVGADRVTLMLTAGAPRVVGDDEDRMLLALRRVVEGHGRLPVHAGVTRGNVFCGDLGTRRRRGYSVMGDTVNLAARLAARAPAGELYASAGPLDRSATRFELRALEPLALKGKRRPVDAWSVGPAIGSRARETVAERFPLVGRRAEMAALEAALGEARRGSGRVVELVGEPGIGKTRLLEELRERTGAVRVLRATCEAYTADTPYVAVRELLFQALGLAADAPEADVLDALGSAVQELDAGRLCWLPLLAVAAGVDAAPTPQVQALAPEFRAARLHEVVAWLLGALVREPAIVELLDAHQMDDASAELLATIVPALADRPWLVVVVRRDTGTGLQMPGGALVQRLEPAPLAPRDALALAHDATDDAPLPPHVVALAVERSGGNPQFLRDLLRAAALDPRAEALPESIEAAATARMDMLAPADRTLIRRAAVLGMAFAPAQLRDVLDAGARVPDARTWERLWRWFEHDDDGTIRFRRAVVREAAYAGLPFRERRRLHAAVAARLEREAGAAGADPALLSMHWALAGAHAKAWEQARAAGDHARAHYALTDAADSYRRALGAARHLDLDAADVAAVWEALADASWHTGELAVAGQAFAAAARLVAGDPVREAQALARHAMVELHEGRMLRAVRRIRRGLRRLHGVDGRPAASCRAELLAALATVRQRQGRMREAIALCRSAIAEAEAAGADAALAHACFILDWALVESGRPAEAVFSPRALEIYQRLGDPEREASVLNNMGGFAYRAGRWDDAVTLYRRSADASLRAGDLGKAAYGECNVAEVLADQGRLGEAEVLLHRTRRMWRATGHDWGVASADALLGRVAVRAGRSDDGAGLLRRAHDAFRGMGTTDDAAWVEALLSEADAFAGRAERALNGADLLLAGLGTGSRLAALGHRVRGFALAQLADLSGAEDALEAALAEARAQREDYEVLVTLEALDALAVRTGRPEPPERATERAALVARLHVVALPAAPLGAPRSPRRAAREAGGQGL